MDKTGDSVLLVIDGNSIINRAFYGTQAGFMKNAEGTPTGAIFGFLNILFKHIDRLSPEMIAVAFDRKEPTFRHSFFQEYKGTRKPMPEDLATQMPLLKELLDRMGIARFELPGYEADDILGTLAAKFGKAGRAHTVILTGDRDALQLVGEGTDVMLAGNREDVLYDRAKVAEMYGGLTPEQLIDLKALQGDSSDNIPGVPGVGPKTATELVASYGSLDGVYASLDNISRESLRNKLADNKELAYLSYRLGTIFTEVPLDPFPDEAALRPQAEDINALAQLLDRLELRKWREKTLKFARRDRVIAGNMAAANPAAPTESAGDADSGFGGTLFDFAENNDISREINEKYLSAEEFSREIAKISQTGNNPDAAGNTVFIDQESGSEPGENWRFCMYTGEAECVYRYDEGKDGKLPREIQEILENPAIPKVLFKSKPWFRACFLREINAEGLAGDLSLASYLLDSTRGSDDRLGVIRFLAGSGAGDDRKGLQAAYRESERKLEELELTPLYRKVELPLVPVLAGMEIRGFRVDRELLIEEGERLQARIDELTAGIYEDAGEEFNINSTRQLSHILFEKLGLKGSKKTKSGYSTNIEVLENLADEHPIVPKIIEYRQNTKLKSTYIDGLLTEISPKTGKVYSNFHQNITATGRLSSSEPNLQNIPIRSELGRTIRKAFVPSDPDGVLIDADYSQIELRVLASMSADPLMCSAFENDMDIHTATAAVVNHVPPEMVTPAMRSSAKAVNFGIVYGISEYGLARDLGISNYHAGQYISSYFQKYSGIKAFMDASVQFAKEKGYAVTLLGRRRLLPELAPSNKYMTRQFGERVAMNMPVQGTAADIIKLAMINVDKALREGGFKSKLILQVHDELLIDAKKDEADAVTALLRSEMENCFKLSVPLKVSVAASDVSWYYCK